MSTLPPSSGPAPTTNEGALTTAGGGPGGGGTAAAPSTPPPVNGHHGLSIDTAAAAKAGGDGGGESDGSSSPLPPPVPQSSPLPPKSSGGSSSNGGGANNPGNASTTGSSSGSSGGPPVAPVSHHTALHGPSHPVPHKVGGRGSLGGRGRGESLRGGVGGRGRGQPFKRGGGPDQHGDYSAPRPVHPMHAGGNQGPAMPSLPTRVSSAPPAENVQGYESTHGYYRPAMDKQQHASFLMRRQQQQQGAVASPRTQQPAQPPLTSPSQQQQSPPSSSAAVLAPASGSDKAPSQQPQQPVASQAGGASPAPSAASAPPAKGAAAAAAAAAAAGGGGGGKPGASPKQQPQQQPRHQSPQTHPVSPSLPSGQRVPPAPLPPPAPPGAYAALHHQIMNSIGGGGGGSGVGGGGGKHHPHHAHHHGAGPVPVAMARGVHGGGGHGPPASPQQGPMGWQPALDHHPHPPQHHHMAQGPPHHHPGVAVPHHGAGGLHGHPAHSHQPPPLQGGGGRRGPGGGAGGGAGGGYGEHGHAPLAGGMHAPPHAAHAAHHHPPHMPPHASHGHHPVVHAGPHPHATHSPAGPRGHAPPHAAHASHAGGLHGAPHAAPYQAQPLPHQHQHQGAAGLRGYPVPAPLHAAYAPHAAYPPHAHVQQQQQQHPQHHQPPAYYPTPGAPMQGPRGYAAGGHPPRGYMQVGPGQPHPHTAHAAGAGGPNPGAGGPMYSPTFKPQPPPGAGGVGGLPTLPPQGAQQPPHAGIMHHPQQHPQHERSMSVSGGPPTRAMPPIPVKRESKALAIFDRDNRVVKPSSAAASAATSSVASTPRTSPALSPAPSKAAAAPPPPVPGGIPKPATPTGALAVAGAGGGKGSLAEQQQQQQQQQQKEKAGAVVGPAEKEKEGDGAPAGAAATAPAVPTAQPALAPAAVPEPAEAASKANGKASAVAVAAAVVEKEEDEEDVAQKLQALSLSEEAKEKGTKAETESAAAAAAAAAATATATAASVAPSDVPAMAQEPAASSSAGATKCVYSKAELERLRPPASVLAEAPEELKGKLQVSKLPTAPAPLEGPGLTRKPSGAAFGGGGLCRSGSGVESAGGGDEGGLWQKKPLPSMERGKSTDSLGGSGSASSRSGTPLGGSASGGGGESWRRGQQLPGKGGGGGGGEFVGKGGRGRGGERQRKWNPLRDTSAVEQCEAKVRGILNKMTWDTFDKLSTQLCAIEIDSKEMLSKIIALVFDKAVDEPNFGEMYATLCVDVSKKSGEWSVVRTGRDLDKGSGRGSFFWTDDIMVEKEIVGPFASREECIAAATAEAEPAAQARTQKLRLAELLISGDRFVKLLESMEQPAGQPKQFFTVFRALGEEGGEQEGEERLRDRIHGGFEDEQSAMEDGHRATTFKKLLLKKCQEEFYKENIYDDMKTKSLAALAEAAGAKLPLSKQQEAALRQAEEEELRLRAKRRMLGNIRFIGELYKKKMLKEHIMHECILKLLGYAEQRAEGGGKGGGGGERRLVRVAKEWDEESLEALCKLLTTVGKQLDDVKAGAGAGGGKGRPPPEHHAKDMAFYYERLRDLSNDKRSGLAARARFMIKDLMELRDNAWVPRRAEAKATRTEEFRRELDASKPGGGGGPPSGPGKGGGPGPGPRDRGGPSSPPLQQQRQGSGGPMGEKGRGADKRAGGGGERGALGGRPGAELRDRRGSIPPVGLRGGPAGGLRHGAPSPISSLDHEEEGGGGGGMRGQRPSLGDSRGAGARAGAGASPAAAAGLSLPREKVEAQVSGMIAEFLQLRSEEEADASMEALPREAASEAAANKLLAKLCECKDADRPVLVQLLLALVRGERVLPQHLHGEVQAVMELLEDIVVDVPHVYDNFALALAALLRTKALDFGWFQREARRALPEEAAFTRLLKAVFRAVDADRRAPWSWDLAQSGGPPPFKAARDRSAWHAFVEEHQLWATYVEPLSVKIIEQARAGGGTQGILAWVRSLDPALRGSVPFTRALAYRLLVECPKLPRTYFPQVPELCTLFTEIAAKADARLQVACLHGIQRFAFEEPRIAPHDRRSVLVQLFEELVKAGAILPGTLSAWEQDLKETPDNKLAQDVVGGVMSKLGADPLAA